MKLPCCWIVMVGLIAIAAPGVAQTSPDEAAKNAARSLADTGKKRFEAGNYQGAIDALGDAEKYYPAPTILWLRALSYEKLGQLREAKAVYEKIDAQQLAPGASKDFIDAKEAARRGLESLKNRIPTIEVDLSNVPSGTTVTLDGEPLQAPGRPIGVNPGKHTILVMSPEGTKDTREVYLKEGATEKVEFNLSPPLPPVAPKAVPTVPVGTWRAAAISPVPPGTPLGTSAAAGSTPSQKTRVLAYIAYGMSAAGLVAGAVLGSLALSKLDEFNRKPSFEVANEGENLAVGADIALSVAVITAVAGTVVWLNPHLDGKSANAARKVYVAPGLGGLTIGGKF